MIQNKARFFLLVISSVILSSCGLTTTSSATPTPKMIPTVPTSTAVLPTPTSTNTTDTFAAINTKNGQIVIKLFSKETPNTVANFLKKADAGFYNGLDFHRVIPGFMAQGGDPTGTGMGGGTQKSELNQIPFVRGSLGLARTADSKAVSNDSQFFICFTSQGCQHLTGDYVNFGEVVSGFEVLDKISQDDKIISITSKTK